MHKTVVAVAALASLTAGYPFNGSAAEKKATSESKLEQTVTKLKSACQSDLNKYCKDVTPGEGRIASCLDSREDQLSASCKEAWVGTKARVSERVDKAEIAFRKSCGGDVRKFCSEVPSGRGRILDCLDDHRDELSGSCLDFHASLDQQLSDLLG